jgi:hypothetical protein
MNKYSEALVGVDTAKEKHAVAIADAGHDGGRGRGSNAWPGTRFRAPRRGGRDATRRQP